MNIKIKNIELLNAVPSASELTKLDLPIKASWNITKNIKTMESLLDIFNKCEKDLIEKYAIKDDDGNLKVIDDEYQILPKYIEIFSKERNDLLNMESEIDISTVSISELTDKNDSQNIKPSILYGLMFMFTE